MSYRKRVAFLILLDSFIVLTAIYLSYWLLHPNIDTVRDSVILITSVSLLICHHLFASFYHLYNKAWAYASIGELVAIVKVVTLSILTVAAVQWVFNHNIFIRALGITWMLHLILIGGSRFVWRYYRDTYLKPAVAKKRTLIIGAGSAGTMVVHQLLQSRDAELKPVAFADDDPAKQKLQIYGIVVAGQIKDIPELVKKYRIEHILIAIPSLKKEELNRIFDICAATKIKTQIMPRLEDIMLGKVSFHQFRDVEVADLLGRDPVELDIASIAGYIERKTILVTGAGGSIGSELCRQVCQYKPKTIVLVGHGENSIYQIDMELRKLYDKTIEIIPVIGDIQDRNRMFEIFENYKPDVVYHAAAHKHVPLMEYNPKEAVKNNIIGTKNVAEAAGTYGAKTFVLISTDKAVNPTNVMGATKRCAELIIQALDQKYQTKFVAVRFGNVLGSRGSVIPLFKKQIQEGGPVTVTHPEVTRYFMTIPEASGLVIQAGALARGGEIFVLDMGEPVKIVDLAKNLIKLSGYTVEEIGIQFTGLRPGEKMFEELLNENEVYPKQVFPKIHIGKAKLAGLEQLQKFLDEFEKLDVQTLHDRLLAIANPKKAQETTTQAVGNLK